MDLKVEKDYFIHGDPEYSGDMYLGISDLREKRIELREDIKNLEDEKSEKREEVETIKAKATEMWKDYENMRDGYVRSDGAHVIGYTELLERHQKLLEEPERILETEAGQKALADAEDRIVAKVQKTLLQKMVSFIRTEVFDLLKEYLVQPLYKAIDDMMYGHSFKLNANDERILSRAIDKSVDTVVEVLDIEETIKEDMQRFMPTEEEIREEVERVLPRRRGR